MPPKRSAKSGRPRKGRASGPHRSVSEWTTGEIASGLSQLWSVAKAGVSVFNTEVKMLDTNLGAGAGLTLSTAGTVAALSQVAEGDDWNLRDGLSLRTLAFDFRTNELYVYVTAATGPHVMIRWILFQDFENLGAAPAVTDVLESAAVLSPYNHLAKARFRVLIDTMGSGSTAKLAYPRHSSQNLDSHINYRSSAASAAGSGEGSIFILAITDAAASQPTLYGQFRLFYVDN